MSRYSTQPPSKSLTYYVLEHVGLHAGLAGVEGTIYKAYDSATSEHLASAVSLEALASACQFLGYTLQKETK
jgi:hypothetical protein